MSIEKEMLAVILKDLPNQTSGVLKSYLEEADKNKKELELTKSVLEEHRKLVKDRDGTVSKLILEVEELKGKIKHQDDLNDQMEIIERQNRDINLTLMQNDIASLKRENAAVQELARTVFRNPVLIKTNSETHPIPVTNSGYTSVSNYSTTTSSTEELK